MDLREFRFWSRQAERAALQRKLDFVQAALSPHMKNEDRSRLTTGLVDRIREIDAGVTPEERWRKNWAALANQ